MNTVKFGIKDSYEDFGLILRPKERPKPTPKYQYVSIPGRNGDLDLTEALGDIFYENLSYSLEFNMIDDFSTWDEKMRLITNYLQGKRMQVIFSEDPDYYYYGRVAVNELSSDKNLGVISLDCNFEPYKYKLERTSVEYSVTQGSSYTFTNGRMKVVPTLTLNSAMTLSFNGNSYSLNAGTQKVLGIEFEEGDNVITITTGTGTLKAEYQEGDL